MKVVLTQEQIAQAIVEKINLIGTVQRRVLVGVDPTYIESGEANFVVGYGYEEVEDGEAPSEEKFTAEYVTDGFGGIHLELNTSSQGKLEAYFSRTAKDWQVSCGRNELFNIIVSDILAYAKPSEDVESMDFPHEEII